MKVVSDGLDNVIDGVEDFANNVLEPFEEPKTAVNEQDPPQESFVDLANEKQEERYEDMGGDLFRDRVSGDYLKKVDLSDPDAAIPVPEINIFTTPLGTQ